MGAPPAQTWSDRVTARRAGRVGPHPQHHGRPVLKSFRTVIVVGALAASAALAGCGSSTPTATGDKPGDGKAIFTDSCGGCHALSAAGTNGASGPELTNIGLSAADVSKQVYSGGGGMPSFDGDLTDQQIEAVSAFVAENDGSK